MSTNSSNDSCCGRLPGILRDEFRCKNFGLNYHREDVFYCSQWPIPRYAFLIYRLVVASYSLAILIYSIIGIDSISHRPWPVYLTNWSYLVLTTHLLCAAVIACIHSKGITCQDRESIPPDTTPTRPVRNRIHPVEQERNDDFSATETQDDTHCPECGRALINPELMYASHNVRWYMQLDWVLFEIAAAAAILVTIVYFVALYPNKIKPPVMSKGDALVHVMNSGLILLEFCFTALPIRLLHFIYMVAYGGVYIIFSVCYWAVDHTNVIYEGVLDWNNPGFTTLMVAALTLAGIPTIGITLFILYQVRLCIHRQCALKGCCCYSSDSDSRLVENSCSSCGGNFDANNIPS